MRYHCGYELVEYLDARSRSPFGRWFDRLSAPVAARVTTALVQISRGNFSNVKGVGGGVLEYRLNVGPGYRIYFARDGERLILLLGGGTKRGQTKDIDKARDCWIEYRKRRRASTWH